MFVVGLSIFDLMAVDSQLATCRAGGGLLLRMEHGVPFVIRCCNLIWDVVSQYRMAYWSTWCSSAETRAEQHASSLRF